MRRERGFALLCVLLGMAALAASSTAFAAASPRDICDDLADNGKLDRRAYTNEELIAASNDASIQGYCSIVVVVPQAQPCTEVAPNTPGATQAPNGKWYTNYNPAMCGQVTTVTVTTPPPPAVAPPAAPAAPAATPAAPAATPAAPAAQPVGGTLPGEKTIVTKAAPAAKAQPSSQPRQAVAGQQSPLRQTRATGTLPFTGAELVLFAIVGAALIGAGLLLRLTGRQKASS